MSSKPNDQRRPNRRKTNGGGSNVVRLPSAVAEQIAEAERQRGIVAGIRRLEVVQDRRRRSGITTKEKREAIDMAKELGGTVEIERDGTIFRASAGVAAAKSEGSIRLIR